MKSAKNPILIIDRTGLIGEPLSLKLSKEFLVVFASRSPSANVPFQKKIPVIPDNKYSHIIFIAEQEQDLEFLPGIIDKVKNVNADFIFAQGLSAKGEYAVGKILRLCPGAKIVLFGDVFSNQLIYGRENFKSVINKFIYQAQRFGKIKILGEGLRDTYPVFLNDAVEGLMGIVSGAHKPHSLFYLFPKHPIPELSLAHMIQKINPEITVDFIKKDPQEKIKFPPNGEYLLDDQYPIAQKIRSIDIKKKVGVQNGDLNGNAKKLKKLKNLSFFTIRILIFLLFSPLVFAILFSSLGSGAFYYAKREIDRGNFVTAGSSLRLSQAFFYLGKQTSNILYFQAKIAGAENNFKRFSQGLESGDKISQGLLQAFNSGVYFSKILSGKSENPIGDFAKGQNYLKSSIAVLDKAKAEVRSAGSAGRRSPEGDSQQASSGKEEISAAILQELETINPLIKLLYSTIDIMPSILGMETPKTYLILFQNNLELRPGGGTIDSYGILKFNLGKITEFSVHDTFDADKQLRGHVEPPFAIRRYLPSAHWYMKDSNFDVDFIKVASASANFLFAETGQKVDGVIGVDSSLRAKLTGTKISSLTIAQAVSDALSQKHLLFAFKDFQNIFTVNGWSSSLWDERKESVETVNDFAGINEANLSKNESSYFIKRQVSQKVAIEDSGNISEELTISYKNENKVKQGGDYKNYLRIILPKNTKLSEILINDISQNMADAVTDPLVYEAKNFKAPQGLEVEKTQENNKTIFGFLVKIPIGRIVKIKLKYALDGTVSSLPAFSYNLKLFKQPGIDSIPYSFSLTYPNSFNIIKSSDKIIRGESKASYSKKIMEDKNLVLDFAKK